MAEHEILTLEEVAKYLRVSERTVYEWASKREIPCGKLGTTWRFKRADIEKWVDQKLGGRQLPVRHAASVSLQDVLVAERVRILSVETKHEALDALIACLAQAPQVQNRDELATEVYERESLMSTGIGNGLGVPHVRLASVQDLVMAVGVNRRGIADYASLDEQPVRIICMIAAHENQHAKYLRTLAALSGLMKSSEIREKLLAAETPEAVYELLTNDV